MVRKAVVGNGNGVFEGSELIYVVGMLVLSVSLMSVLLFACADQDSGRPRNRRGRTGGAGGGGCGGGDGGGGPGG